MLVDANLLLYAVDQSSPLHHRAAPWLEATLNGDRRVGLAWQTIGSFVRIATHPRIMDDPLTPDEARDHVSSWLASAPTWVPPATHRTVAILSRLVATTPATGNLVPDAQLAALAIEHGLVVHSNDADFARFADVRWHNPLTDRPD